jgi:succinate dehydrogenase/fumarate reductase cytochrome b subunit
MGEHTAEAGAVGVRFPVFPFFNKLYKTPTLNYTMKKEENSFGVAAVVFGILSIIFASLNGIILGIVALVFAKKQQSLGSNKWGKNGKVLAIIGIVLSIAIMIFNIWAVNNPGILPQGLPY